MTGEPTATGLFATLAAHPGAIAAAVGLLAFVESLALVGIVTPGVALLAAGAAAAGAAGAPLSMLLAAGWIGAVLGDGTSFLIGHRFGPAARKRLLPRRFSPWIERGERFFARYGMAGVVLGRFIGPLRPVIPIAAGMLRMDPRLFFAVNITSALAWAPAYLLPGYIVGASVGQGPRPPADWPFVLAAAALGLWIAARSIRAAWRSGERGGAAASALGQWSSGGRWITVSLARGGGADTRLSLLLATGVLLLFVALAVAALALPSAARWRDFLDNLAVLVVRLW